MKSKTMNLCRVGALAGLCALTALLVACGDEVTNNNTTNVTGAKTVADLAAAGACDESAQGEIVLNEDDGALYVCYGGNWISMKGADGEQGEPGAPGAPGTPGAPGVGVDGAGCASSALKDDEGVTQAVIVACGDRADTLIARGGILVCGGMAYDSATTRRLCDTRNDKSYKYVRIGDKDWMAENLDYDYKVGGASYGNSAIAYGRVYTWGAAMDSATTHCGLGSLCGQPSSSVQGVCPDGWHLPDTAEYSSLIQTAGGRDQAGKKLKATTGWSDGTEATDSFGFTAFPSSDNNSAMQFFFAWSSTGNTASMYAHLLSMSNTNTVAQVEVTTRNQMQAVRCVKN